MKQTTSSSKFAAFAFLLLLPAFLTATTIIGVRGSNRVFITTDGKPQYKGKPGDPQVCKIFRKEHTYFAIAGLDHDALRGVFFQKIVADVIQDDDPFPLKLQKIEDAVKPVILKEMITLQTEDPETYKWVLHGDTKEAFAILVADYNGGLPHLAARGFNFIEGNQPSIQILKCDYYNESGICYMGPSKSWIQDFAEIQKQTPDALDASRGMVEKDMKDAPNDVGPPIVTVLLDNTGEHVFPPSLICPIDLSLSDKRTNSARYWVATAAEQR